MTDKIRIIGIPVDLGQILRGVDMGPSAVRYAGLADSLKKLGYDVSDFGNVRIPVRASITEDSDTGLLKALCKANKDIYKTAKESIEGGYMPIFLGGDHSLAIGTIGGITHNQRVGVIWIDAHGDFNTP